MATVHANKILTKFMLLLGGHNHCVKVSSDSETVRGMGLWEFSGALRELMLSIVLISTLGYYTRFANTISSWSHVVDFSQSALR